MGTVINNHLRLWDAIQDLWVRFLCSDMKSPCCAADLGGSC